MAARCKSKARSAKAPSSLVELPVAEAERHGMSSRILLIEDEPGLVLTVSDLLQSEGYEIQSAADGEAGLATAIAQDFDLIILDVMLPRKSGFEVCRELRQRKQDVAVLMLTAKSQVVDRVAGLKLGADDYLAKPFDPAELLARVEALLRRTQKTERASRSKLRLQRCARRFRNRRSAQGRAAGCARRQRAAAASLSHRSAGACGITRGIAAQCLGVSK